MKDTLPAAELTPYVIGRFYDVPVIELLPGEYFFGLRFVPVFGPMHNDKAIINFDYEHWHIDFRFISKECNDQLLECYPESQLNGLIIDKERTVTGKTFIKRLRMKRPNYEYPAYKVTWLPALEKAYADQTLGPKRICPHRGADLSTIEPDADGLVTCPLHGLIWNTKTGCMHPNDYSDPLQKLWKVQTKPLSKA